MKKSRKLIIVGDSAFAEIAREYFQIDTDYEVVGFAVEAAFRKRDVLQSLPVVDFETLSETFSPDTHDIHVAIAYAQLNRLRARLAREAKSKGYRLASYVSPRAFVWQNVQLGEHCFIFENNTIQPFVVVGDNVVMWSGNHIGHHSCIRDNVFISSHAVVSGFCDVGDNCFLGVNSTLANNTSLGRDCWLGPGVIILSSVEAGQLIRVEASSASKVTTLRFFGLREP